MLSLDELLECGLTYAEIRTRVDRGWIHRRHRGVYGIGPETIPLRGLWLAAVKACGPTAMLSGLAGGAATGYVDWHGGAVDVTVVGDSVPRHRGIRVHRTSQIDPRDFIVRDGIPMLSAARMALDLAGTLSRRQLREAIRRGEALDRVTLTGIARVLVRLPGRRGARNLAAIVARGDVPTRSALEDIVHDLLLTRFAPPDVNVPLHIAGRTIIPDFRWATERLIVEADGAKWHDGALAQADDAERQAILEAHGERVVRVRWDQAITRASETLTRVGDAGAPLA